VLATFLGRRRICKPTNQTLDLGLSQQTRKHTLFEDAPDPIPLPHYRLVAKVLHGYRGFLVLGFTKCLQCLHDLERGRSVFRFLAPAGHNLLPQLVQRSMRGVVRRPLRSETCNDLIRDLFITSICEWGGTRQNLPPGMRRRNIEFGMVDIPQT